jgi:hypothetical protein
VHDGGDALLPGATVTGTWSGGGKGSGTCTTDGNGMCTVTRVKISRKKASVGYTVSNITLAGYAYTPSDNEEDPATVAVPRP